MRIINTLSGPEPTSELLARVMVNRLLLGVSGQYALMRYITVAQRSI